MTSTTRGETATIYQFPVKSKIVANALREFGASAKRSGPDYADCAFGGAWYHEDAIAERDLVPKR